MSKRLEFATAILACGLAFFSSLSVHAKPVRFIFKATKPSLLLNRPSSNPMSFGLSSDQMRRILELTVGQVDFGGYYSILGDDSETARVRGLTDYLEAHALDIPPPVAIAPLADPELENQWWLTNLNVKAAWSMASGQDVTIADCDAGFYLEEPDLKSNLLDDLRFDFANPNDSLNVSDGDFVFHGTAVVAIMAGVRDGLGTNGIAFSAHVVPFQNFNYNDQFDKIDKEEATARCILQAIKTPEVQIVVLENQTSNGSSETFLASRDAVRLAIRSGLTVVSAAGNSSVELSEEANDDTGSILVGAVDPSGNTEHFSNYGPRTTIAAFGEQLHTLYGPNGAFGQFGGTSGATAQVAGAVALMKEVQPLLSPLETRALLIANRITSTESAAVGGLLDVERVVRAAKQFVPDTTTWTQHQIFRAQLNLILN